MKPFQQRVVVERNELRERLERLKRYIDGAIPASELPSIQFPELPDDERKRLSEQRDLMQKYLNILEERIENFRD